MANFNRMMAKELAKTGSNVKIIHGPVIDNIKPDIEWLKWLSYESEYEKNKMELLNSKKISELSYEELIEICRYRKNKIMAELFQKYRTGKCSEAEYLKVYDFMCNESLEELMLSKLTKEELHYAKQEIARLSKLSKEQLSTKIKEEQQREKYEQLSMVDSYILHLISNFNYAQSLADFNILLNHQLEQNELMRQRSYITN